MTVALASCGGPRETASLVVMGLIDATEIDVASKVPGRVKELKVREGDHVQAGDTLAVIESLEIDAKVRQVSAAIEAAQARLKMARKGARDEEREQAKKALDAAQHQVDLAKKMYDRMKALLDQGSVPQATYDDVAFKYDVARDQLQIAQARYDMVKKGARDEEIEALEALVRQAEGTLDEVRAYEAETDQKAPITGEVTKVMVHAGELAATGYPIVTLVDLTDIWATFAVREDLLKRLPMGARLTAEVPALGKTVEFQVFNISALGDFATWRATSEKNSFDLKSFEVKARPVTPVEGLRPGMTVRWRVTD
ncbi:MAG TPA: HlyD family efflux transporter periplasmic adaptor subunit [Myxococcota bacterium]|nr:HlyD family efflux transporter periplasmic adaptor subunit [Myxococcota bacterium]HQK51890.1 HlyD family efflux transporter periplasmic adaptor subunit [Myxococcota bacterium]